MGVEERGPGEPEMDRLSFNGFPPPPKGEEEERRKQVSEIERVHRGFGGRPHLKSNSVEIILSYPHPGSLCS